MDNIFITEIKINKLRHLDNITIPLSNNERKHLILTGKNGCGKTTVLSAVKELLEHSFIRGQFEEKVKLTSILQDNESRLSLIEATDLSKAINQNEIIQRKKDISFFRESLKPFEKLDILLSNPALLLEKTSGLDLFPIVYFSSTRKSNLDIPKGIQKVELTGVHAPEHNLNKIFLQYIVNLKAERSFARDDGDDATVAKIDAWFANFENRLKKLFHDDSLSLAFDSKNFTFNFKTQNREPFGFNELSDGYSAVLNIVTELILRMEKHNASQYDLQGIVLIDEIETHLHVELQKEILPFLIDFFPNIQFIVTSHSPFVLSSAQNVVIYDLEKHILTEDLTAYSYDTLVESYFDNDNYSQIVKDKVQRYEQLYLQDTLTDEQVLELEALKQYFDPLPKFAGEELQVLLQQIRLKKRAKAIKG
jgi:predicted ATP-dependent endonuclease of OLD family